MHSSLDSQSLFLSSTPDRSWFFLFPSLPEYESTIIVIGVEDVLQGVYSQYNSRKFKKICFMLIDFG